jgi:hypothetical protein
MFARLSVIEPIQESYRRFYAFLVKVRLDYSRAPAGSILFSSRIPQPGWSNKSRRGIAGGERKPARARRSQVFCQRIR